MTSTADVAGRFKAAMVAAARTAIADDTVLVCYGHPGKSYPDDVVSFGRVTSSQVPGPISASNRARDNTLTVDVLISVFRRGGSEQEQVAGDRAYRLLTAVEEYVRVTDTTLGGLVRWCFCTEHESDGSTDAQLLASGRVIEITATFTALSRITS